MSACAVVFDLDDTIYPERRFLASGFAAVAAELERSFGIPRVEALALLTRELVAGRRPRALQALCAQFRLTPAVIPGLVRIIRNHRPRLRLAPSTRRTLQALRPEWRVGILTNGDPGIQARKVAALQLHPLVDAIVYAQEHGGGGGKPDPACFQAVSARLRIDPASCVFVGNDPWCDIRGARQAGMLTIHLRSRRVADARPCGADAVVGRLVDVPSCAARLLEGERLCA